MNQITVVNIKCKGCAGRISSSLEKKGLSNVSVDPASQTVSFSGDVEVAKQVLNKMGYPEVGSQAAKSLTKKAKSYVSYMIGKSAKH